jgi:hypothetical protein
LVGAWKKHLIWAVIYVTVKSQHHSPNQKI